MFSFLAANSQKLYFAVETGYGLSLASQNLTSEVRFSNARTENTVVIGSLGKGITGGLTTGYYLTDDFAIELNVSYLHGAKYRGEFSRDTISNELHEISAQMLRIAPGVRLEIGEGSLRTYLKIGLLFRGAGKISVENTYHDLQENSIVLSTYKYNQGFSIGGYSSIGFTKKINDSFRFFSELNFSAQSWAPKDGLVTSYKIDGIEMVHTLTISQRNIEFLNNYSMVHRNYTSWAPQTKMRQVFPFSSFGIKVGIQLDI